MHILQNSKTGFILFLLLAFISGTDLHAQILNIEKIKLDSMDKAHPYQINFESNFNFYNRSGSADEPSKFVSFGNDLDAVVAPKKTAYIALGNLSYSENNGATILNNGYLHLRTNFGYRKKWSEEIFGQVQYDNFRGLNKRYLLGVAERWHTLDSKKIDLFLGSGPMYEHEVWRSTTDGSLITVNFLKLSTYFIARWDIAENVDFNTIFYYQVGYDNSIAAFRNRISSSSNLNFKIAKFLSFTTSVSLAFEDKPIIPITRFIYGVENGLTLTF